MSNINEDIKAAIDKNLPAQIGEVLQARLKKAEITEAENNELKNKLSDAKSDIARLEDLLSKHQSMDAKLDLLISREEEVSQRERDQKVFEAELKASAAEFRAGELRNVLEVVFRSPKYRTMEFGNQPVPSGQFGTTTLQYNKTTETTED